MNSRLPRTSCLLLLAVVAALSAPAAAQMAISPWQLQATETAGSDAVARTVGEDARQPRKTWVQQVSMPPANATVALDLPDGERLELRLRQVAGNERGSVTLSGHAADRSHALLTFGGGGVFGDIHAGGGRYMVSTDAEGTWLLRIDDPRFSIDGCPHEHFAEPVALPVPSTPVQGGAPVQIDVMILYPPSMTARYPGALLPARLDHLLAISNQAMRDSQASVVVRLVHHQLLEHPPWEDNGVVLNAMRAALAGNGVPPFVGLDQLRAQHGADLVVWTWPHDIETRGSCGVAFLPVDNGGSFDPTAGVHVTNDGISNWSVCSNDVFTHELGHNLGALHQRFAGQLDHPGYAHVAEGRFNTVMGSFGSAHADRFRRLAVFSNPNIQCGGEPCGSAVPGQQANQVQVIGALAPVVAGYQASVLPGTVTPPPPSHPDSDGDGVSNWLDPYPFDPYDNDPPPSPPLPPFSPLAVLPGDAIGNFQLLVVSSGDDRIYGYDMQGRSMGVVAAPLQLNPRPILSEHSDLDVDDEGRLYLLANGDVQRYSRERGQLIDVFLDSFHPSTPPPALLTGFSRAMGFKPDRSQLVVLGDYAVERFAPDGTRLTVLTSGPSPTNPSNWNNVMSMPLRAFAFDDDTFYLTENVQRRIMAFDSIGGDRLSDVTAAWPGLVQDPRDLAIGPDGGLYLADGGSHRVLRFDTDGATPGSVFVAAGAGGLSFARALAFGPDGHLYVASRDDNRVLRYDGATGAFLGVFVDAGVLDRPEALRFTPKLDVIFRDGLEDP